MQDTYIDQTFSDLDGLDSNQLQDEQMKTLILKNSIDSQILHAKLKFQKERIKADPTWLTDATFKSKLCGFRLERIKHLQTRIKRDRMERYENSFNVQFVAIARQSLPEEIFQRLVDEVNHLVKNEEV